MIRIPEPLCAVEKIIIGFWRGGVVIPLIFPKVPQLFKGILRVPQLPPPLEQPIADFETQKHLPRKLQLLLNLGARSWEIDTNRSILLYKFLKKNWLGPVQRTRREIFCTGNAKSHWDHPCFLCIPLMMAFLSPCLPPKNTGCLVSRYCFSFFPGFCEHLGRGL